MDQSMEIILNNLEQLIPLINGPLVTDLIYYKNVLTEEDFEIIQHQHNNYSKTESLLLAVGRRGPEAMYALKDVLVQIENYRAMEILNSGCTETIAGSLSDSEEQDGFSNGGYMSSRAEAMTYPEPKEDGECESDSELPKANDNLLNSLMGSQSVKPKPQVKPGIEVKQGDDIYPMKSFPRGYCLLINNVDFQVFDKRASSESDGVYLTQIFQQLGFQVNYFKNQRARDIEEIFREYSRREALKKHDAFVCIILSHGQKKDLIVGSDGRFVRLESLLAFFNNYHCPNLINKPKLFFIQACRGDEFDYGTIDSTTTADAASVPKPLAVAEHYGTIPTWSDMCIVHSTLQGYVALRHLHSGSWFVDALGLVLTEYAGHKSLHEILMEVCNNMISREGKGRTKQAIEVVWRGWTKSFFFNPGFYSK